MKVFLNISFFIFLINGYLSPIFSFENTNHNIFINQRNLKINLRKNLLIVSKDNSEKQDFILKEIPDYSVKNLKSSVKQNKDPFLEGLSDESSSFDDLYLILLVTAKFVGPSIDIELLSNRMIKFFSFK